ncbi:MAG: rhodanese-like domain-containing protein [Sumerlaeia bacterium]
MYTTINAQEFKAAHLSNTQLAVLDVRTPVEFKTVHVAGARLCPLGQVNRNEVESLFVNRENTPLYVLCKAGSRACKAADKLGKQGVENIVVVEGGTDACIAAGLPVERGANSISLERQVRIAVGSLNLIAALLAIFVHPMFVILCGFFGAGLLFAGLTDWCGMGLLLAKMPWNKVAA